MKSNTRRFTGTFVLVLALAAMAGCDAPRPEPATASSTQRDVTREAAIQNAQRDAAFRYAEVPIARVDARRLGGFWVIELTAANGSGLRYTISALDGSIRQRNSFQ
jgi:hypothetical protein